MANDPTATLVAVFLLLVAANGCGRAGSGAVPTVNVAAVNVPSPSTGASSDGHPTCLPKGAGCEAGQAGICCPGLRCILYSSYDFRRCLVPKKAGELGVFEDECASRSRDGDHNCK